MDQGIIYRCTKCCPIGKHCFVLKSKEPLQKPIEVYQKCKAESGKDILVKIGAERPP